MMASTSRGETFVFSLTLLVVYVSTSSIAYHNTEYFNMTGLTYQREAPSSVIKTWIPVFIVSNNYNNKNNCNDGEYYFEPNNTCLACLSYGDECLYNDQCCYDEFLECAGSSTPNVTGCFCKGELEWDRPSKKCVQPSNSNTQFIMAAQIALGASLVVAVSALTALTCKMCSSRRELEEMRRRDSGASSLNSIQRFVISRLRDRPPRYDDVPDKPPSYVELPPDTSSHPPPPTAPRLLSTELQQLPPNPPEYSTIISDTPSTSTANNHFTLVTSIHEDGSLSNYSTGSLIPLDTIETSGSLSRVSTGSIRSNDTTNSLSDNSTGSLLPSDPVIDAPDYVEIIVPNAVIFTTQTSTNISQENGIDNPAFVNECHM